MPLRAYAPHVHHTIKLFEVFAEKVNGKTVTRTLPLGAISMEFVKNRERRKINARALAEKHVGRRPSNVSHSDGDNFVATFRKA